MQFQRETLFAVFEEVQPLLEAHHLELNGKTLTLEPRWDIYAGLMQLGAFVVLTARDDGKLVGYSGFFLNRHMHHAGLTYAQNDVLYLMPEHRRGTTASQFIDFSERELKDMGADKLSFMVPTALDWRAILHRKGYCDEEVMCAKYL